MAAPSHQKFAKAVEAFINARSWKERKRIVETRRNMLLTDTAEQILNNLLERFRGDTNATQALEESRDLLMRCRQVGVESAFADYLTLDKLQTLLVESSRLTDQNDIPYKVKLYQEALELVNRNTHAQLWAELHAYLAISLAQNPLGERDANLEQAIFHFQQALQIYTLHDFPEQWAQVQFHLGLAYADRSHGDQRENNEQTISHFRQALQVYTLNNFPEQWAETQNSLAIALSNRTAGSQIHNLEQAIQIWEQILNAPSSSPKQHYLSNLAIALRERYNHSGNIADLEQAIQLTKQSLAFFEDQGNVSGAVSALRQLGTLTQGQGNYAETELLLRRTLEITEQYWGDTHPDTATSLNNLAEFYKEQGKYAEAEPLYQQALHIWKQQLGPEHPQHIQSVTGNFNAQAGPGSHATVNIHTPERYVNVCIVRQEDRMIVPKTTSLGTRRTYDLRLDIGPFLDESVVQNAEQYPFPVNLLPPTNVGYWLEVIVVSDDFVVPLRQHHLFLPRLGPSWVCDCPPGKDHQCSENERQPYLFISIQTLEQPQVARLRIAIYYQRNLIQSQLLTAKIAEMEQIGAGHSSIIDYSLTSDLRDLSFLPPRTLHILTNDNAEGSHRVVINSEGDDVLAFHLTEGQIQVTVDAAREALRNVHFEEYGGTLGSRRQRRNLLDSNNAKMKEAFIKDLTRLAPLGWKLWTLLLKDRLEWRKKLLASATIQVSRTISSTLAFPWALVYDIPLDSQGPYKVCPLVENWDGKKALIDASVHGCPHESMHGLKNALCPFGFWGFRHVIEQPASMPRGRNLPVLIHMTNQPPELVVGLSQALDKDQTEKHLQAMKNQLTLFTIQDQTSLKDIITTLADPVEVVYFYCHGGREPLVGTSQHTPYLQVGEDERFQPSDITTWRVADWPEHHWEQTSPLVFINGCHTAELTPELLVNFVDAFSTAYAAGVIGTEISVEQDIAAEAAERFFDAFQQNKTVGQALQQMRLHFLAKGNLLGLAYTPYCSANLHL